MKNVRITCGGYGYTPPGSRSVRAVYAGDTICLPDAEAKRLEALHAAVILDDGAETVVPSVATPPAPDSGAGVGGDTGESESSAEGQETADTDEAPGGPAGGGDEDATLAFEDYALSVVSSHLVPEDLMKMTKDNMVKLAADMGVDIKACKTKAEIAAALAEVEVEVEEGYTEDDEQGNGDAPPDLSPGGPV